MRTKFNVSLPPSLKEWVEQQVDKGGYGTASEYIGQLIREERKRIYRANVEKNLQEALDSGDPQLVTGTTWRESEKRVHNRVRMRRAYTTTRKPRARP